MHWMYQVCKTLVYEGLISFLFRCLFHDRSGWVYKSLMSVIQLCTVCIVFQKFRIKVPLWKNHTVFDYEGLLICLKDLIWFQ